VVRHGHVVAEAWWRPFSRDRVHLLYSLSKSFTSAAAGLAQAEGLLDMDATVLSCFPELDGTVVDPRSRAMRVRDIAAMASGHLLDTADVALPAADPIRAFLSIPPKRVPGTFFAYNQLCTYTLAAIIQDRAGVPLTEYLRPRLFEPLGIVAGRWWEHPSGREVGYSGLHLTTESIAAFGQCLLDGGRFGGRQVLPPSWVEEASRVHVATPGTEAEPHGADWAQGYGMQFWRSRHGFRGDGAFGQFCVVVPESDLVVATTAATPNMPALLAAVWDHILPALEDAPLPAGNDDEALRARLAGAHLPAVPQGGADALPSKLHLAVTGRDRLRGLGGATLCRDGGAWMLELEGSDGHVRADVGIGGWRVTDPGDGTTPVAVSAGSPSPGVVRVDVLFLETPHRLRLEGPVRSGGLRASWTCALLGDASLRSCSVGA
jgi:CubicO group peptidase (beta-lactamase class C family)